MFLLSPILKTNGLAKMQMDESNGISDKIGNGYIWHNHNNPLCLKWNRHCYWWKIPVHLIDFHPNGPKILFDWSHTKIIIWLSTDEHQICLFFNGLPHSIVYWIKLVCFFSLFENELHKNTKVEKLYTSMWVYLTISFSSKHSMKFRSNKNLKI